MPSDSKSLASLSRSETDTTIFSINKTAFRFSLIISQRRQQGKQKEGEIIKTAKEALTQVNKFVIEVLTLAEQRGLSEAQVKALPKQIERKLDRESYSEERPYKRKGA